MKCFLLLIRAGLTKAQRHAFTIGTQAHSDPTSRSNYTPFIDEETEVSMFLWNQMQSFLPP